MKAYFIKTINKQEFLNYILKVNKSLYILLLLVLILMESISKFLSGYIKTILFAIEYKPKF